MPSKIFRYAFWAIFFGIIGLLLGSKSIQTEGNVLLEYSLIGSVVGLIVAHIFNTRDG